MTNHRFQSILFKNLAEQFAARGYTEHHVAQAIRLLESLDYDIHVNDWDERRRFVLFDGLSKVAFTHVIEAEKAEDDARSEILQYAQIAQCAMELVCHNKSFSNELLKEMCDEAREAA